jgi:hypothetical protein
MVDLQLTKLSNPVLHVASDVRNLSVFFDSNKSMNTTMLSVNLLFLIFAIFGEFGAVSITTLPLLLMHLLHILDLSIATLFLNLPASWLNRLQLFSLLLPVLSP